MMKLLLTAVVSVVVFITPSLGFRFEPKEVPEGNDRRTLWRWSFPSKQEKPDGSRRLLNTIKRGGSIHLSTFLKAKKQSAEQQRRRQLMKGTKGYYGKGKGEDYYYEEGKGKGSDYLDDEYYTGKGKGSDYYGKGKGEEDYYYEGKGGSKTKGSDYLDDEYYDGKGKGSDYYGKGKGKGDEEYYYEGKGKGKGDEEYYYKGKGEGKGKGADYPSDDDEYDSGKGKGKGDEEYYYESKSGDSKSKGKGKGESDYIDDEYYAGDGKGKGSDSYGKGDGKGKGYEDEDDYEYYYDGKGKGKGEGKGGDIFEDDEYPGKGAVMAMKSKGKGKGEGYYEDDLYYGKGKGKGATISPSVPGHGDGDYFCYALSILVAASEVEESENAVGGTYEFPFYEADSRELGGVFVDASTSLPEDDCIFTGAFNTDYDDLQDSWNSTLSIAGTCSGTFNTITGGTGNFACASGFHVLNPDTPEDEEGYLTSTLYICQSPSACVL